MSITEGPLDARKLQGVKYFELMDGLRTVGTARDRAGNRQLYLNQYATLMILYYFNPTVGTLLGCDFIDSAIFRDDAFGRTDS